jgi:hypothetical protein
MKIIGTNEFEKMYWKSYTNEQLRKIITNEKLLETFRKDAKKQLELRQQQNEKA